MTDLLKELILDYQQFEKPAGFPRHLQYQIIKKKAFICIGVRRCGKTTLLYQIIDKLQKKKKIASENIVYLNFFDDRIEDNALSFLIEAYYSLYPDKRHKEKVYFILDELQEMTGWERFVNRILNTENCEVFISGSSAKLLSKEIATQMRGRSLTWELFPFSFKEFADKNGLLNKKMTSQNRILLKNCFDDYFNKGGFPEVMDKDDRIKIMIHQEYYKNILHRDIIERFDANHPQAVIKLSQKISNNISSLHSLNKLTEYLRSMGFKCSKQFVSECLGWYHDAYLFFPVSVFSASISKQNANPKKYYAIDHSLMKSVSSKILRNYGQVLENIVFMYLRRLTENIYYYKTKNGKEVDFITVDNAGKKNLIQVSFDLENSQTIKRETSALFEAMTEQKLKIGTIITYSDEDVIEQNGKKIKIIPAWKSLSQRIKF